MSVCHRLTLQSSVAIVKTGTRIKINSFQSYIIIQVFEMCIKCIILRLVCKLQTALVKDIATLPGTEINYNKAWSLHTSRYDNKRTNPTNSFTTTIVSTSSAWSSKYLIRKLLDVINNKHLATLVHVVSTRLSLNIRQAWESNYCQSNDLQTWQKRNEFIEKHIHVCDIAQLKGNIQHEAKTTVPIS